MATRIQPEQRCPADDGQPRSSLVDLLAWRAQRNPAGVPYTFLPDGESDPAQLTYAELDRRARAIAAVLQERGAAGRPVLIVHPPGLDYIAAFFGCLYAGSLAVPLYPPDMLRFQRTIPRLQAVARDARAHALLTTAELREQIAPWFRGDLQVEVLASEQLAAESAERRWARPALGPANVALLQYTSGSTGDPKGVMVTHGNLIANIHQLHRLDDPDPCGVSWLPPYHDMGLVGGVLLPLCSGGPITLFPPLAFAQRPLRWLELMTRTGAHTSGAPNFAFELCVRKSTPAERRRLDLSRWTVAMCGAEPIRAETIDRFVEAFGPCGFRREAFYPCYGLAEATLIATGDEPRMPLRMLRISAASLENGAALPPASEHEPARTVVGCGPAIPGQEALVVDPRRCVALADDQVGEIWLRGESIAAGYWNRPRETEEAFAARLAESGEGPYLRTGDLGFLHGGELYVTGRQKDLIIVQGRNHYPQDVERTVATLHPALRADAGAAFSVDWGNEERLVVVQEIVGPRKVDLPALLEQIRCEVLDQHDLDPAAIVLIQAGSLPKTSSGKIQRHLCRQMFLEGQFIEVATYRAPLDAGSVARAWAPPETETERALAALWHEVFGPARVGRHTSLFEGGAHSLLIAQLVARIAQTFGATLELRSVFLHPTLEELARAIDAARAAGPAPAAPLARADRTRPLPLSGAQRRLWFLEQLDPGSPVYVIPAAARLRGPLDRQRLQAALADLAARHEALRTQFALDGDEPAQWIAPAVDVRLGWVDLGTVPAADREAELDERLRAEARRPFDLARAPLWRAVCYRLGPDEHVLLLVMHHAIADGWSIGQLVGAWAARYEELRTGRAAAPAAAPYDYADFAAWEAAEWAAGRWAAQAAYWDAKLRDLPPPLELPGARRVGADPAAGATLRRMMSPSLGARLIAASRSASATPFMTLLAGVKTLLHRYTGQRDLCVGTVVANRARVEWESVAGFFANTLVLRSTVEPDDSFADALARARQTTLEAFSNSQVPLDRLLPALGADRAAGGGLPIQVALVHQNLPPLAPSAAGTHLEILPVDNGTAKFDLTLTVSEEPKGLVIAAEYRTDVLPAAAVERLLGHLETLLDAALLNPEARIDELPLLDESETDRVLDQFNATAADYPADRCVHELIAASLARRGDAEAVRGPDGALSARELNARSDRLARQLRALGVDRDQPVGLYLERGAALVVGLLGIWKAGGAYVPLDPAYPAERLAFMLRDAGARLVVTDRSLAPTLPAADVRPVLVEDAAAAAEPADAEPAALESPRPRDAAESLAYVIYTSGSTGQPKGVEVTHRTLANFLASFRARPGLTPDDVWLAVTTLSFDIAALELFLPLWVGARVVIAPREALADGRQLAGLLDAAGATVLQATPATWTQLLDAGYRPARPLKALCGGEALRADLARRIIEATGGVWNLYGPTETTVWSAVHDADDPAECAELPVLPIGRPIANTRIYVLDAARRPVPIGVPGELYIGGAGLARGYRGRPELTAERFVEDPWSADPAGRMYRTGDLARWREDGVLEFLGRVDHQVKIRGHRVELGEIESVLAEHHEVRDVAVVVREDVPGDVRLVAYYVPRNGSPPSPRDLRSVLSRAVPGYMIPAAFVRLEQMPRTPNGKLDRRALPSPRAGDLAAGDEFEPPATPLEVRLAAIWREILRVERVGRGDDFFALGGHSLLATQVAARIRGELGIDLPLRTVFEARRLSELAEQTAACQVAQTDPAVLAALLDEIELTPGDGASS